MGTQGEGSDVVRRACMKILAVFSLTTWPIHKISCLLSFQCHHKIHEERCDETRYGYLQRREGKKGLTMPGSGEPAVEHVRVLR